MGVFGVRRSVNDSEIQFLSEFLVLRGQERLEKEEGQLR